MAASVAFDNNLVDTFLEIVFHIGMHKTATTSFQNALRQNAKALSQHDIDFRIHWPKTLTPMSLAKKIDTNLISKSLQSMEASGTKKLIVSSEAYTDLDPISTQELIDCFLPYETTLLVAFRHWCTFLPSRWNQNCRRRDSISFSEFIQSSIHHGQSRHDVSFDLLLRKTCPTQFQKARVISYDNALLADGIVPIMWKAAGLPNELIGPETTKITNVSASTVSIDIQRLFNGAMCELFDYDENAMMARSSGGKTTITFFDLARNFPKLLQQDPMLTSELYKRIQESSSQLELNPKMFEKFEATLEKKAAHNLWNPVGGKLFGSVKPTFHKTSSLKYRDLPQGMRQAMQDQLSAAKAR